MREELLKLADQVALHIRWRESHVARTPSLAELREWEQAFRRVADGRGEGVENSRADPTMCAHKFMGHGHRCLRCGWDFSDGKTPESPTAAVLAKMLGGPAYPDARTDPFNALLSTTTDAGRDDGS